jgi:hypothetical protein
MSEVWGFGEDDLMTPEEIVALLLGLQIEAAEVRRVKDAFSPPDDSWGQAGPAAHVAFVRARKPLHADDRRERRAISSMERSPERNPRG